MKTAAGERRIKYRPAGRSIFGILYCCWQARVRWLRESAGIAVCAFVPAFCLYLHDRSVVPTAGGEVVAPVPTQTVPSNALWIDARPEADYRREHVPGALNLNEENWKDALGRVFESWQPSRPVVVYCAEGCSSAGQIAQRLSEMGIEPVQVFAGGFERWKQTAH